MPKFPKISAALSADPSPGAPRPLAALLTTRVLLVSLLLGAAVLFCAVSGMFVPFEPQDCLCGRLSLTVLLTALAALSQLCPASGPRFAERVPLTPLVALIAVLLLPPSYALIPLGIAGAAMLVFQRDPLGRRRIFDRLLLVAAAQLGAGMVLTAVPHPVGEASESIPYLRMGAAGALLYGVFYLVPLAVVATRRARASQREWSVYWENETVVYVVGAPFAVVLSLVLARVGALEGACALLVCAATLMIVARALVDGKLARAQLRAMERLTQQAAIGKSPSTERFLTDYIEHCSRLVLFDHATVWLNNEEELVLVKTLEFAGRETVPFQPQIRRSGEFLVGRVAERFKAILVADVRRDARHPYGQLSDDEKRAIGPVSVMLIPLLAAGELIGVVEFERRGLSSYGRHDRERVQSLGGLVAMSLANNRLHNSVVQQAVTDGLTGLYNKRQILKTLQDETLRAQRYAHTLSVLMLDLDGFKKFNDTYGHMQGDVLLQSLAELIRQSIRASDVAGRYGGEEFIVVMPETGREAAWVTAERIRARVESEHFHATVNYEASIGLQKPTESSKPSVVTVRKTISIGVATFPVDAHDPLDLLARADEALYAAKNNGRNRVVLASYPGETQPQTVAAASEKCDAADQ